MKTQIHRLRTQLAQLPASPLVDLCNLMLDGYEEIDSQIGEFDESTCPLYSGHTPDDEEDPTEWDLDDSHWGERFGKVVAEVERVLNQTVRVL